MSVIVPTLDESDTLPLLLEDLRALPLRCEVIVADGGSSDGTAEQAEGAGAIVLRGARGRGRQLADGARTASAPVLCFLHADVRVGPTAQRTLAEAVGGRHPLPAVFELGIDAEGIVYRLIELMANRVRTRMLRLSYGDQGLIVSRDDYDAVGGYRDVPLMEDVEIVRALRKRRRLTVLPAALVVSPRRWQQDGPWRRTFRNWALMIAYSMGASPQRLADFYAGRGVHSAMKRRASDDSSGDCL